MGCVPSKSLAPSIETAVKNEVDEQLAQMQEEERTHYKVLLLGPGEAGKSTVLKQLKCIYKGGIPLAEQRLHGLAIRRNTIQCMQAIIEAMGTLNIELTGEAAVAAGRVAKLEESAELTQEVVKDITMLWEHEKVQEAYGERHRYWLLDAAPYYFEHMSRMVTRINDGVHKFSVVDVGGQRSERRKWIHCFDDVKAIIFVVALSGYNQVLFEDTSVNRMHEGLQLFEEVVQNPIFQNTPIFVFLNKKDLFEQMMDQGKPLSHCFPDYRPSHGSDASDVQLAIEEIERRFRAVMHRHNPRKHLYIHVMASRVRLEMKGAFTDVKDRIKDFYAAGQGTPLTHASGRV